MAILSSCLCCSLLLGSIIAGVYVTIVYLAAFIVSVWWIVEAEGNAAADEEHTGTVPIPIPAYLLSLGYFIVIVMSVWMLQGLYRKNEKALLVWVFVMTLFCFPEMGMVIFMSLVHWKITSSYGLADLIFYLIRATFNLMAVVCVHSQYSTWKEDIANSETLKRLEHLHMNTLTKNRGKATTDSTTLAYHNPAFVSSAEPTMSIPLSASPTLLQRSYSRASQISGYQDPPPQVLGALAPMKMGVPGWDPYISVTRESQSEFNAAVFSPSSVGFMPLIAASRSEAALYPTAGYNIYHHNPQAMYPMDYPYVSSLPPTQAFSTQSLDRRRYVRRGRNGVPSTSMDALNIRTPAAYNHQVNGMVMVRPNNESRSSLGADSDDLRRYRDVAL
ncbi:uncharacterized protein LOC135215185 isoform X2 [Macrobrachium nipponense]|uniref:uncharacterized protein LOC135215185 isoform X2 n=1 Tax=Macrobrachium nipponense TaxID=159736 RepID=UPI0030C7F153